MQHLANDIDGVLFALGRKFGIAFRHSGGRMTHQFGKLDQRNPLLRQPGREGMAQSMENDFISGACNLFIEAAVFDGFQKGLPGFEDFFIRPRGRKNRQFSFIDR